MSNLKIYAEAETIILDRVSLCLSANDFHDPDAISLRRGQGDMTGKYILTFGRGACKVTLTEEESNALQLSLGVKLL